MTTIAAISDIHGNLVALEAVLADIRSRGISDVVCLGDLAYRGPFPEECVARIRGLGIPTVQGNMDMALVRAAARRTAAGEPERALRWHVDRLTHESIGYLRDLPFSHRRGWSGRDWLFVHATPQDFASAILPDDPEERVWERIKDTNAAAVVMGHIHHPFIRTVRDVLLVNTGSVGFPKDGDWRASYAILDLAGHRASIVRVEYDIDAVVEAARARDFFLSPDGYGESLRRGRQ